MGRCFTCQNTPLLNTELNLIGCTPESDEIGSLRRRRLGRLTELVVRRVPAVSIRGICVHGKPRAVADVRGLLVLATGIAGLDNPRGAPAGPAAQSRCVAQAPLVQRSVTALLPECRSEAACSTERVCTRSYNGGQWCTHRIFPNLSAVPLLLDLAQFRLQTHFTTWPRRTLRF
jgi:hypothetical protein